MRASHPLPVSLLEMLERFAVSFYEVIRRGEVLITPIKLMRTIRKRPDSIDLDKFATFLSELKVEAKNLGLVETYDLAGFVEARLINERQAYSSDTFINDMDNLLFSFGSALGRELLFRIPHGKEQYLEKDSLFGPSVLEAFPSSTEDVKSAGTCFAVGLYDASVFHLMQILQIGMNVLAQKIERPV